MHNIENTAITEYHAAAKYLGDLFDALNAEFFHGELPAATLTIQSTPRAYGHFTPYVAWASPTGSTHEINLGAESLNRPIVEVATTLYHEMVHLYCFIHGIRDTSPNGIYHTKSFKREAEAHGGATITQSSAKHRGWTETRPSEKMVDFVSNHNLCNISLARSSEKKAKRKPPATLHPIQKYTCPRCGIVVRTYCPPSAIHLLCMKCNACLNHVPK